MATINLAEKYSPKVVDKFYKESVILGKSSKEYDWDGVKSIKVWTINTYAPTDYLKPANDNAITGAHARYGSTYEVADTIQTMTLTRDRAVSLSVDKGNNTEQMLVKNSGKVMSLELREQFVPEFDKYALARYSGLMTTAPSWASLVTASADGALTKANIVEKVSDGVTALRNDLVDINDCYLYIGESNFAKLLLAPEFINYNNPTFANAHLEKGVMGKIRGVEVVAIPDDYFTTTGNTNLTDAINFMIVKKASVIVPTKIKDMKVHSDPVGISGALLEVRWLYDAFVLETKAKGIYVSKA